MPRVIVIIVMFLLASCGGNDSDNGSEFQLNIADVLGGDNVQDFLRADAARTFIFPEDHGLHEGFRNEWWYLTGNLETESGRRFGYQITFFNVALAQDEAPDQASSAWKSRRIWMAHAALTDVEDKQHIALERFSRENPGLAGAQIEPFKVWLENWALEATGNAEFPWHLTLDDDAFSLDLLLNPEKKLVLQGDEGLSQKSPEQGNASYYYSFTRLETSGTLTLGESSFQLNGSSWLDREWSSSVLAEDQTGWDWFSLQFNDGQELMYYQLRDTDGLAHPNSQGNWTDTTSRQTRVIPNQIQLEELQTWTSSSGISYTTEWALTYKGQRWIIQAVLEDQLMDLSLEYWEGAVDVRLAGSQEKIGHGYLEMLRE